MSHGHKSFDSAQKKHVENGTVWYGKRFHEYSELHQSDVAVTLRIVGSVVFLHNNNLKIRLISYGPLAETFVSLPRMVQTSWLII